MSVCIGFNCHNKFNNCINSLLLLKDCNTLHIIDFVVVCFSVFNSKSINQIKKFLNENNIKYNFINKKVLTNGSLLSMCKIMATHYYCAVDHNILITKIQLPKVSDLS